MVRVSLCLEKNDFEIPAPEQIEKDLLLLINKDRAEIGLNLLENDYILKKVAKEHTKKMIKEKTLSHNFKNYDKIAVRLNKANSYYLQSGENIAKSETYVARFIHHDFMNSPGHRKNILNYRFSHCGISVIKTENVYYVTQVFAKLYNPVSNESMEIKIKNHLSEWFLEENEKKLLIFEQVKDYARKIAEASFKGEPFGEYINEITSKYGKVEVLKITSPEYDKIMDRIKTNLLFTKTIGISLGVFFGRRTPGADANYTVVLLNFGNKFQDLSQIEMKKVVLEVINERRRQKNIAPINMLMHLNRTAYRVLKKGTNIDKREFNVKLIKGYEAARLNEIPDLGPVFTEKFYKIGIYVEYPLKHGILRNMFKVIIVTKY